MRFRVILVRHGETRYNKAKLLQGQGVDEPLSEFGSKQAKAAGQALSKIKFSHVFSSDLQRAKQTASAILSENICGHKLQINCDPKLRERKYGIVEGKPLSELRALAKAAGQRCPAFTPPGAETVDEVQARAKEFFNYLCNDLMQHAEKVNTVPDCIDAVAEYSEDLHSSFKHLNSADSSSCNINNSISHKAEDIIATVLIVSHGGFMLQWVSYFVKDLKCPLPLCFDQSKAFSVCPNAGISSFVVTFDQIAVSSPQIICDYLYDCSHLEDIGV
ncbi:fructose-2,6-bisphosphatase TIGAR-like isoform X2 [Stegostoma tigrinum]|uniref:fructose-2,6-bisphosphatase TIGAR-like isoform X2 n=1 Tax=Stegostoma tigrinum TaxID=3053191 RepID=UPI00286FBF11|nr:fructose-2,6-bisphosphatase TIGAR-like isoform X2 [Stegostoma tigrinum]